MGEHESQAAGMGVAETARFIGPGRGGRPTHPQTVLRWISQGVVLSDGQRLRMEAIRRPGGWFITRQAVDRFLEAVTADRLRAIGAGPAGESVLSCSGDRIAVGAA